MFHIHYLNKISDQGTALWTDEYALTGELEAAGAVAVVSTVAELESFILARGGTNT